MTDFTYRMSLNLNLHYLVLIIRTYLFGFSKEMAFMVFFVIYFRINHRSLGERNDKVTLNKVLYIIST